MQRLGIVDDFDEFPELLSSGFIEDWLTVSIASPPRRFPELLSSGFIEDQPLGVRITTPDEFPELLSSGFIEDGDWVIGPQPASSFLSFSAQASLRNTTTSQ